MAAPIAPESEAHTAIAEDALLDAYLELEGEELAWLGYTNEALLQAELDTALDVTGSG